VEEQSKECEQKSRRSKENRKEKSRRRVREEEIRN
jgi:hypothetical protein